MSISRTATPCSGSSTKTSERHRRRQRSAVRLTIRVRATGPPATCWQVYEDTVNDDVIRGNLVTDAHIAALMRQHGVATIWTADRDFRRFADVTARDPYAEANG